MQASPMMPREMAGTRLNVITQNLMTSKDGRKEQTPALQYQNDGDFLPEDVRPVLIF